MDLMSGLIFKVQTGLLGLAFLLLLIAFGGGTWWQNSLEDYQLDFSLWKLCSKYKDFSDVCFQLDDKQRYLKSGMLGLVS